jgi:hypothetical protein
MSTTSLPPAAPVTSAASRVRPAILAALLALGALVIAAMVLWQPWGERDAIAYADLAPNRDAGWLGSLLDGVAFGVVGVTLGLAVCLLAPARGAVWATVGAVTTGFGGVLFAAGILAMGTLAWYATATDAIPADAGTGPQAAGFLLFTLGSLALMVALWRSGSVPRWLPVAYGVLTLGVFALDGVVLNVVQAVQMLTLVVLAGFLMRTVGTRES